MRIHYFSAYDKPILLTIEDDPKVLNAIARDLRHHFRSDYRVIRASSGAEALETIRQLKQRGAQIALFLVDERMPHMTGTQLLLEAVKIYPEARRVLLTAYADTDTAITFKSTEAGTFPATGLRLRAISSYEV